MSALRRGIAAAVLTAAVVGGGASGAAAQGQPYDMVSPSSAMRGGIPSATIGWRFDTETVAVVVPETVKVDNATLRTIDQAIWATEPVRFRRLEVWHPDGRMLYRQPAAELRRTFGARPPGLPQQSLKELGDSLDRAVVGPQGDFTWLQTIAFAVVVSVVAIMLVGVLFVLVSAQWRRTRADTRTGNLAP